MVALALLTVLSLLWMARRVRRRGRFGPSSSAARRSLSPVVLGLGGWFLGALIVSTTVPDVRFDDQLLVTLAVGAPIGAGVYLAWAHRDWSAGIRTAGFAAATVGALVGAWLGFHATDGLLAPIAAVVGAAAGANGALLAIDIRWDRLVRDRVEDCGKIGVNP